MDTLQLTNLGPLISASEMWHEDLTHKFWLSNDNGKAKLVSSVPEKVFARIDRVDRLTTDSSDFEKPLVEIEWPSGRHQLMLPAIWGSGAPYEGRPYQLGVFDCYSLVRDWMRTERGIEMSELTENPERFVKQIMVNGIFSNNPEIDLWERVVIPQAGDGILFSMTQNNQHSTGVTDHTGVYLGDNRFLHHFANRISCECELDVFWKGCVSTFMRRRNIL